MAKILIVDDEKEVCDSFREFLEEENHEVEVCLRGTEAIEKVKAGPYDLVFLDVLMPQMEGREVLESIRRISPAIPVAIMSGYMPPNKEKEALAMGAVACLAKPLDMKKVKSLIKTLSARKPA